MLPGVTQLPHSEQALPTSRPVDGSGLSGRAAAASPGSAGLAGAGGGCRPPSTHANHQQWSCGEGAGLATGTATTHTSCCFWQAVSIQEQVKAHSRLGPRGQLAGSPGR